MSVSIHIHPQVDEALRSARPVVALESAVMTSGLPNAALGDCIGNGVRIPPGFDAHLPVHIQAVRRMIGAVQRHGAVPAVVAIIGGTLHIGLEDDELDHLASFPHPGKCSSTTLATTMALDRTAGTTVSATLAASRLAGREIGGTGIRVMATGGIGGVHRNWQALPDISADLRELAATPVCVVCSGAKSLLDVPATVEALEMLGIPLLGWQTDDVPRFISPPASQLKVAQQIYELSDAAAVCRMHWGHLHRTSAVVLAQPVDTTWAVPAETIDELVNEIEAGGLAESIESSARTPIILDELGVRTAGRSLIANLVLLEANAALAAGLAVELAEAG